MTSEKTNEPVSNSGLIELSKLRESIVTESRGHDVSLLTDHVPSLRADRPRRQRVGAAALFAAGCMLIAMSTVAYALHHQVTQHSVAEIQRAPALKVEAPTVVAAPEAFAQPQPIAEVVDVETPEVAEAVDGVTSVARPVRRRARSVSMATIPREEPSSSDRSIDELLHAATGGQVTPREGSTRPSESTLPMRPARSHVSTAFRGISRAVQQCAPSDEGVVSARVIVDGSTGRVRSASLSGATLSSGASSCVERALRGVRLDPFQQDRLEITFPYRL